MFFINSMSDDFPYQYGIQALEVYIPKLYINQSEFEEVKGVPRGKIQIGLGQEQMSFVSHLEDVNSMALTVLNNMLERTGVPVTDIGKLEFGTETLHDKSKSTKTILMKLLGDHKDVEGVTHLNACYGGTAALLNCVSWGYSEGKGRLSVVVMADVAVYNTIAAQPTGGAGAIAILLGPNPAMVIEPLRASYFTDVYDFYKPDLDSEFPIVDGKLSTDVYLDSLSQCFEMLKRKYNESGREITLEDFNFFLFHCPFAKQVEKAFLKLMYDEILSNKYPLSNRVEMERFIKESPKFDDRTTQKKLKEVLVHHEVVEKLYPGLMLNKKVGNIYTGSLYLSLASLLLEKDTADLCDKKVFMFSYGSGAASTLFSIRFKSSFAKERILNAAHLRHMLQNRTKADISKFEALNHRREALYVMKGFENELIEDHLWEKSYYLNDVDKLGRRGYQLWESSKMSRIANISSAMVANLKFRKLNMDKRHHYISEKTGQMCNGLLASGGLDINTADNMIENCIGTLKLPMGVGLHFRINGMERIVPMVTEEASVIAATSNMAKLISNNGPGFRSTSTRNIVRGQIFIQDYQEKNYEKAIMDAKRGLINYANEHLCPQMVKRGGGVVDILTAAVNSNTVVLYLLVDVQDVMGANVVNTILENIKEKVAGILKGSILMCIISNLCPERVVHTSFEVSVEALGYEDLSGLEVAQRIIAANDVAKADIFRAATHNKGIMNGISAVCLAVGQDTRATEASIHSYASYKYGTYRALTEYYLTNSNKNFKGEIEMPFMMGIKGGATTSNPLYMFNLKVMGSPDTRELANIASSVGLSQNLAALRALVTSGIQKGHMRLHARNIAMSVGITPDAIPQAVSYMIQRNSITQETANEFLNKIK